MSVRCLPATAALILFSLVATPFAPAQMVRFDGHRVVRVTVDTPEQLDLLLTLSDDVWTDPPRVGAVDVRVTPEQFKQLQASGLDYDVVIADVQRAIDKQLATHDDRADAFDNYMNFSQVLDYLGTLVALHPDLAETFVAGQSIQGRDIVGIRISGPNPSRKPGVLYQGCHHAREWITVSASLYVADHLIRQYDSDPDVQYLVDHLEWFIVPVMNPDGYVYTWNNNRMWRKNRRYNGSGIYGVDLNRNWSVGWGGFGSSGDPSEETYRGPSAFSEPETCAMRDWILNHPDIIAYCDLHSYGQLIMYPYGYYGGYPASPDLPKYEYLAETMAALVYDVHEMIYEYGTVYYTIYMVSGGSVDWVHDIGGAFAFTYELRDLGHYGFTLPASQIHPNCEEILPALLFYADYLYEDCNGNEIWDREDIDSGLSADCNTNNVPDECEAGGTADCNLNSQPDLCDIYLGVSLDCNENAVPDECDLDPADPDGNGRVSPDCQPNGIPDECDLAQPTSTVFQDDCAAAQLVCTPATYYGTTVGASNDGSCSCGSAGSSPDVWYYFMPYGGGEFVVSLVGSSFDTVLSVHSGCPGTVENELACNDDYLSPQSRVDVFVADHQEYWIRVAGKNGVTGDFQLTVTGPECIWDPECNDNGIPDECEPDCNDNGQPDDCDIADGISLDENGNGIPDECEGGLLGDLNCDEVVNAFDIDPFVLALSDPDGYATAWPDCDINNADCNEDGEINTFDIDPFVALLTGG